MHILLDQVDIFRDAPSLDGLTTRRFSGGAQRRPLQVMGY